MLLAMLTPNHVGVPDVLDQQTELFWPESKIPLMKQIGENDPLSTADFIEPFVFRDSFSVWLFSKGHIV